MVGVVFLFSEFLAIEIIDFNTNFSYVKMKVLAP